MHFYLSYSRPFLGIFLCFLPLIPSPHLPPPTNPPIHRISAPHLTSDDIGRVPERSVPARQSAV